MVQSTSSVFIKPRKRKPILRVVPPSYPAHLVDISELPNGIHDLPIISMAYQAIKNAKAEELSLVMLVRHLEARTDLKKCFGSGRDHGRYDSEHFLLSVANVLLSCPSLFGCFQRHAYWFYLVPDCETDTETDVNGN